MTQFEQFSKDENIRIRNIIYNDSINLQILNLVDECFMKPDKIKNEDEEKKDLGDLDKKNLRKALGVSIVPEKKEEENLENEPLDRNSQGSVKIKKEEEYDFAENLMKGIKKENIENPKKPDVYGPLGLFDDNTIINFPSFDFDKERKKDEKKKNKSENEINQLMQYYLFLAYYLEEVKKDEESLNYFLENISVTNFNDNKENDNESTEEAKEKNENPEKININKIILRLYKLAYKCSDKKHRDYPYYSFYNLIEDIDSEELKTFNGLFDLFEENDELGEIYRKVIIEKQQLQLKKLQKMEMMSFRNNTSGNIARTNTNYKNNNNNNANENNYDPNLRKSNIDMLKNKISSSKMINLFSLLHKRQSIQNSKSMIEAAIENPNIDDFNINYSYIINSTSDFNASNDNNITPLIINDIADLLSKDFPTEKDFN